MDKINREKLEKDLVEFKSLRSDDAGELHGENKTVYQAAAILLKLTDPKYVPTDKMSEKGFLFISKAWGGGYKPCEDMIYRAMMKEIVE